MVDQIGSRSVRVFTAKRQVRTGACPAEKREGLSGDLERRLLRSLLIVSLVASTLSVAHLAPM